MESADEKVLPEKAVLDLLRDVVIAEGIIDPVNEISSAWGKGDGFMSYLTRVKVKGKNKVLSLIIKTAPSSPQFRKSIPIRESFLQEIRYYSEILPAYKKFQNDRGVKDLFKAVPRCYKTVDTEFSEVIVMEDIREQGFMLLDKKLQMDEAHVELVLREYGKFHAVSFAIKDQDLGLFESLTKDMEDVLSVHRMGDDFFEMLMVGVEKMASVFDRNTEADVYSKISKLKDEVIPFFTSVYKFTGKYGVIAHKDGWRNNMMFKYEGENSTPPTDMRLLDFQLGTLASTAVDLSYFFYSTANQEMLDNLDHYLRIYHQSLSTNLLEMGSDPDKCFPFSALKEEWRKYSKYGFIFSSLLHRVLLRDDDETLDFADQVDTDSSFNDTFMKSSKRDDLINDKYRRLVLHYYENNFL